MSKEDRDQDNSMKIDIVRQRLTVTGVVQGVGFRPFIYGLALENHLAGFVGNDSSGVFIEIEGPAASLAAFRRELLDHHPPLAHIESVTAETISLIRDISFEIVRSQAQSTKNTLISPDICVCEDCYREMLDPSDRRFGYPFINCTNCGPRFSIITDIPYDRPLTTMADFPMCRDCQEEYENPLDRRFHAQPNACHKCGPHVWLELVQDQESSPLDFDLDLKNSFDAIMAARLLLSDGKVVAIKGLGGFHLACDASDDAALQRLRERKGRVEKPFAVMALDVEAVREFADLTAEEEDCLVSKERPILLLRKKTNCFLSDLVAPGNRYVGVMLPYTPLHYLLLQQPNAIGERSLNTEESAEHINPTMLTKHPLLVLVMTSGNYSDEPIVKKNKKAREFLSSLSDAILFHNRDIYARCDDSVIRILDARYARDKAGENPRLARSEKGALLPIRRSRGYAPFPVKMPFETSPILAVGGELKATFCLAKGQYAFMSQHIGDMENLETLVAFESAVTHFQHIFRTEPKRIACDLHPGYLSSRWAQQREHDSSVVQVQHHHAHIASVMAEHQLDGSRPVIGFSFDGTGYGTDGAVWGGEVLLADYQGFDRASYLKYVPLVGGDAAVLRPYRLALAHLKAAGIDWDEDIPSVRASSPLELDIINKQMETDLNSVPTSSMGRLFDAVASICGIRQAVNYEAQAAIELESLAASGYHGSYAFAINEGVFDAAPVIQAVVQEVLSGVDISVISARFHRTVAELVLSQSINIKIQTGLTEVALSGGVFQNATLLTQTIWMLQEAGFTAYYHHLVPPNDGGLALGQAIIASVIN